MVVGSGTGKHPDPSSPARCPIKPVPRYLGPACHSSCYSARTAPISRSADASSGKTPTTSVRRLISLFSRSSGFVDQTLRQWSAGKVTVHGVMAGYGCRVGFAARSVE